MEIMRMIQIIYTIAAICVMVFMFVKVRKKNDKTTYEFEGMILGFSVGSILGSFYHLSYVGAPIGMLLGIVIGKKKKRDC